MMLEFHYNIDKLTDIRYYVVNKLLFRSCLILDNYYYCPYCGQSQYTSDYGKTITCMGCLQIMTPYKSKYNKEYYTKQSIEKYKKTYYGEKVLFDEEIKNNPLFNEEKYMLRKNKHKETLDNVFYKNTDIPKCPTCGSDNIDKISSISKIAGAATFGLFSKTARSQFKCNNCGYKW